MPTIHDIRAIDWHLSHDLSTPLTARGFDITYMEILSNRTWDPTMYDQLAIYKGEANPDLVRIRAEYDGEEREVVVGVADRSGRRQSDRGVVGVLNGRDRMALALDGYPTTAFTIDGINVVNNAPVTRRTYQEAVADIASRAGLAVIFDIGTDDYAVGASIPVTTSTTYGRVLADLLEPWRLSEKFAHDAWVDGTTLRIVRRDLGVSPTVQINMERLLVSDYRKSRLVDLTDVRVEGVSYQTLVDDPAAGCAPIEFQSKDYDTGDPKTSYHEQIVILRNAKCQVTRLERQVVYDDNLLRETTITDYNYLNLPGSEHDGLKSTELEQVYETNTRTGFSLFYDLKKKTSRTWEYDAVTGDTLFEDEEIIDYDSKVGSPIDTLNESSRVVKSTRYVRSFGQLFRTIKETRILTGAAGTVANTAVSSEVSPYKVAPSQGTTVPYGKKQETVKISAGAESAKRTEQNDLIGDNAAAALIRTRLLTEHGNVRVDIVATMAPDHRVVPGRFVQVLSSPSWWDVSTFYVLATDVRHDDGGAVQEVRAVAWL